MGFNRYMVECKYSCFYLSFILAISFNRYMVECKFIGTCVSVPYLGVLIDTWWNVNLIAYKRIFCNVIVLIDTWWNVNS